MLGFDGRICMTGSKYTGMEGPVRMCRVLAVLLVTVTFSMASTLAELEFLGFSADGSHAGMIEHWVNDGSGCPAARLIVMSVDEDTPVILLELIWPEFRMQEFEAGGGSTGEGWNPARDSVLAMSAEALGELGIGEGRYTWCIHHPVTDLGVDGDRVEFALWAMSPMYFGQAMTLSLQEELWEPVRRPDWFDMVAPPVTLGFTLTDGSGEILASHTDGDAEDRFVSERFVSDYSIRDVYVFGGDGPIAVVLNTMEPGFEGPDGHYRLLLVNPGE